MRRIFWTFLVSAALVLMMSILGREALAQSHRMQYHGGKVLPTFTIYPLYYGAWSARDIEAQQQYLHGLAAYLSGHYNPPQQQTMMKQYGVHSAAVAGAGPPVQATSPLKKLSGDEIQTIIHEAQGRGELPAYAADRLIMGFRPTVSAWTSVMAAVSLG